MAIGVSNLKEFGLKLKEIRRERGIGVRKMARLASTSTRVVYEIEKGTYNFTAAFLDRYSRALGIRVELYTWRNTT